MSGQLFDNPYAAPQVELQRADLPQAHELYPSSSPSSVSASLVGAWIVVCLNLPFPALMGLLLCHGLGVLGVFMAVVGWLSLTTFLFRQTGRFAKSWIAGGLCVAASQFLPYLHLLFGIFAVSLFNGQRGELTLFPAMICTIIVGGGLLSVSLALGAIFYLLAAALGDR